MYTDSRQYFRELYSDEQWKSLSECYGFDANADRFSTSDVLTWSQGEGTPAPQAPLPALIGAYLLAGGEVELGRTGPTRRHDASVHRSPSVVKVARGERPAVPPFGLEASRATSRRLPGPGLAGVSRFCIQKGASCATGGHAGGTPYTRAQQNSLPDFSRLPRGPTSGGVVMRRVV